MTNSEKKKYCSGCRDDFYNGKNPYGIKECWSLKDAVMVLKKEVHVDQRPPWNQKAKRFLSCFRRPRHVYVGKDQTF